LVDIGKQNIIISHNILFNMDSNSFEIITSILDDIIDDIIKFREIRCLVLNGGGINLLTMYRELKSLYKKGLFDLSSIHSFYATSSGTLLAILLSLQHDWETSTDFIVHRPWGQLFQIQFMKLFDYFQHNGIFGLSLVRNMLKPLFNARDLDIDTITFDEYKELVGVSLHFFAVSMTDLKVKEFSPKLTPNVKVIEAIHASSALPILFQPIQIDGISYIDGGFLCNYPLFECLAEGEYKPEEILGLKNTCCGENTVYKSENNLFQSLIYLMNLLIVNIQDHRMYHCGKPIGEIQMILEKIKGVVEIPIEMDFIDYDEILKVANDKNKRITMLGGTNNFAPRISS